MKRLFSLLLLGVLCFSLCACETGFENEAGTQRPTQENNDNNTTVHTHSWASATCTSPKTCTTCGETSGSPTNHSWSDATCTDPKICTACGATDSTANGHSWKEATCSAPKTCTECGQTSGSATSHNYSNGKCTGCGKQDPNQAQQTMVWIPTNGGTKYHSKSSCSNMKNPRQVTKSEAERQGYTPCSRCY